MPDPLVDYGLGDQVYLTAKYPPRIEISNQAVRVFGMDITIDDEGNERLGSASAFSTSKIALSPDLMRDMRESPSGSTRSNPTTRGRASSGRTRRAPSQSALA